MADEWYCPATKLISDKKVLRAFSLNIYSFNQINTGLRDTIITHKRKGKGKFLFGGLLIQEFWNPSGTSSFVRGTHLKEGVEKDKEKKKTISKRGRLTTMSTFLFSFGNVEKIQQHRHSSEREGCSQLWPRLLFNMSSFLFSKGWKETDGGSSHTLESVSMKVAESARLVEYQLQALLQKKLDTWDQFVMCPTFRLPQLGVWSERDLFDKIPVEKLELKFSKVE